MMSTKNTLLLLIRLLQECLEEDYTVEELRSKIRDMLRLLGVCEELRGVGIRKDKEGDVAIPIPSYPQSL